VPSATGPNFSPIPPCSCSGDCPPRTVPVAGCAPVDWLRLLPATASGSHGVGARWLLGRGCLELSPEEPLAAGGPSPAGSLGRRHANLRPLVAGGAPGLDYGAETALARIIALGERGPGAQAPIQRPRRPDCRRFSVVVACCWPCHALCSVADWHQVVAPGVAARPRVIGAWAGQPCSGGGRLRLFHWRFKAIACSWWPAPVPWACHAHPHHRGSAWRLAPPAVPRW